MSDIKRGKEAFEFYYSNIFGERWTGLKKALMEVPQHYAWWNPKWEIDKNKDDLLDPNIENLIFPQSRDERRLYFLDRASAFCVEALDVKPDDHVLDMCAAPGGKSLGLAMKLQDEGTLLCNELSASRRGRLKRVLAEFLTASQLARVQVKAGDAGRFGRFFPETFDKILLDAPCSSERHLLHNAKEMQRWSPARSKKLSKTQGTLLASAFDALRPTGRLVYSTCSLSTYENDGMAKWLTIKRSGQFDFEKPLFPFGESTEFGHLFLPDQTNGPGPLYITVIRKN
jgi:16S rRNA C967 or C1407 C5-methylase (RsmB/RsmF family)